MQSRATQKASAGGPQAGLSILPELDYFVRVLTSYRLPTGQHQHIGRRKLRPGIALRLRYSQYISHGQLLRRRVKRARRRPRCDRRDRGIDSARMRRRQQPERREQLRRGSDESDDQRDRPTRHV